MTGVLVRRLVPIDAAAYHALRLRGMLAHPEAFTSSAEEEASKPVRWSEQRLTASPDRPHDFFLGAFQGDSLWGIVGLQGRYRPKERHNATVVGMYVAPELSGQGAGRALMRELLQLAASMPGLEQLDLTVTAGNDRAQALYARCGFSVCGSLPRAIQVNGTYYAKVHMVRWLR